MATSVGPEPQLQFGVFTVHLRAGELRKFGTRIKLQDRPFQILAALLEHPGEVVTRDELRQRLWSDGTYVDFDHSISSALNKLRVALGDSAATPRYIETVGRRGYRFIYPVSVLEATPPAQLRETPPPQAQYLTTIPKGRQSSRLRSGILSLFALIVIAAPLSYLWLRRPPAASRIRSIAVLPLANLSNDPSQEYFSDGLTEELTARIALLPDLHVISRTSASTYKNTAKTLPQIAGELHVDAVIEGSVLRSGNRVRVTVQLVEGSTDRHLWAGSYEREQQDILSLQNEVTRAIANQLELSLNPGQSQRFADSRPLDPQAHEAYLRGRYHFSRRSVAEFRAALKNFEEAVALDPGYARAYAGIADCYALIGGYSSLPQGEFIPKARAAALKAIQLDDSLAEAHTSLAVIAQNYDWDWQTAEREYRRAIELDPNYATAHHWYAELLSFLGRFDESFAEFDRAQQLDPLSLIIPTDRAVALYFARKNDKSIQVFREVLAVDPSFPRAHMVVEPYLATGKYSEAEGVTEHWNDADGTWRLTNRARIYARTGRTREALACIEDLKQRVAKNQVEAAILITPYLDTHNYGAAISTLESAYRQRSTAMTVLKVDPALDPIRSDPRFIELMRRVGLAR